MPGDCGSWVIDPTTGDIYGIIIATAPGAQESYLIPAYQVFDSIKSKLPTGTVVEFPTLDDALESYLIPPWRYDSKPFTLPTVNFKTPKTHTFQSQATVSSAFTTPKTVPLQSQAHTSSFVKESMTAPLQSQTNVSSAVKKSDTSPLKSQANISSTEQMSSRLLEWYCFDKRGEDWAVAARRMIHASQGEIIYKVSIAPDTVLDQVRRMSSMRKRQIDRLIELRKHFWEGHGDTHSVPISIRTIQTTRSEEKHQNGKRILQVLTFDVIISISVPPDRVLRGVERLADGVSDIRLPIYHDTEYKAGGGPGDRSVHNGLSEKEKWHIPRGSEGQNEDHLAEEKKPFRLGSDDHHPDFERDKTHTTVSRTKVEYRSGHHRPYPPRYFPSELHPESRYESSGGQKQNPSLNTAHPGPPDHIDKKQRESDGALGAGANASGWNAVAFGG